MTKKINKNNKNRKNGKNIKRYFKSSEKEPQTQLLPSIFTSDGTLIYLEEDID